MKDEMDKNHSYQVLNTCYGLYITNVQFFLRGLEKIHISSVILFVLKLKFFSNVTTLKKKLSDVLNIFLWSAVFCHLKADITRWVCNGCDISNSAAVNIF